MIIAQDQFRDEEYAEPKAVFESRGHQVTTASFFPGQARGKLGMTVDAELGLDEVDPDDYEAVVFVGGSGAAGLFNDPSAHRIAVSAHTSGSVLGAICIAPSILGHAGLLAGVRATAFPSQREDLAIHGAHFTGDPVEVDGRIVTANGPDAAREFGERVTALLDEESVQTQREIP